MTERHANGTVNGKRGHVERAFWIVVIVSFIILSVLAWQIKENRKLISEVADQGATITELQTAQRNSCTNYVVLRDAVNDLHGAFISTLETAKQRAQATVEAGGPGVDAARNAVEVYSFLIANTHTVHKRCAQKPVAKAARRK